MSKAKHTILPGGLGEAVVVRHSDEKRNIKDGFYPAKITRKYKNPRDPFNKKKGKRKNGENKHYEVMFCDDNRRRPDRKKLF